jgi:hypothetical protein
MMVLGSFFSTAVQPAIAKGTAPDVPTVGWLAVVVSLFGAGGGGIATLIEMVGALKDQIKVWFPPKSNGQSNPIGDVLTVVVDASQDRLFAKLINNEKDPALKAEAKTLWKKSKLAQIDRDVPTKDEQDHPADVATIAQLKSQLAAIQSSALTSGIQ